MRFLFALPWLMTVAMTADPLVVSTSGVYNSTTPVSSLTAPGDAWSLSFTVDSNPTVTNVSLGNGFDIGYSNFSYALNGTTLAIPVADIRFFNGAISGLFTVCFNTLCPGNAPPATALVFEGAQAFSGSESAPVILPGVYNPTLVGVRDGSLRQVLPNSPVTIAPEVPEPSTLGLLGGGISLICFAFLRQGKRRRKEEVR